MRNILFELAEVGTTIIISSHNLTEVDRLTDTIYFMKDGEVLEESLESFITKEYFMRVSDLEKAEKILKEKGATFSIYNQERINFLQSDIELQTVISYLNEQEITIIDIEHECIGAERRYKELFEGASSK